MTTQQQELRLLAVRQDADAWRQFELGSLWQELRRGAWRFRDTFATDERHVALLQPASAGPSRPLDPRRLRLFESVLLGAQPKVAAMDFGCSLSSVTNSIQDCLRGMGLSGRAPQASMLLTLSARAFHRPASAPQQGRLSEVELEGQRYSVVSALRPDLRFPVPLSLAEAEVLRSLVAGQSYAQISWARATSRRTVANQLATAFKKLGVSGRRATIDRLIQHSVQSA